MISVNNLHHGALIKLNPRSNKSKLEFVIKLTTEEVDWSDFITSFFKINLFILNWETNS